MTINCILKYDGFNFDEMTARAPRRAYTSSIIYLLSEYEGDRQQLQCVNITMFSAILEIQSYVSKEATMFTLARPTVGRRL